MLYFKEKELVAILQNGESTTIEFKRKIPSAEKIAKEIVALANTLGGYLFIGVDDNGKVYGVKSEKAEIDTLNFTNESFIFPPIDISYEIIEYKGKDIIIVKIPNSLKKPHKVSMLDLNGRAVKRAFIRVGEQSVMASSEMTRLMTYQNIDNKEQLILSIGDKEKALFAYLNNNKRITVKEYTKVCNISKRRAERLLIRLVRAGVIQINTDLHNDYFTLVEDIK